MIDPFEELGEKLTPKWKKQAEARAAKEVKRAATPPMVKHGLEKEQEEKAKQMIRYRKWKAEVREGMTRGDYGMEIVALFKHLKHPERVPELINYVLSADWIMKCSFETRVTLLGYIDDALVRYQIRNGYPPFDDPLPEWMGGGPPNAFLIIRKYLTGV